MDKLVEKWRMLCEKVGPVLAKVGAFFKKVWNALTIAWAYVSKLRKIFVAIPIVWAAIVLAVRNLTRLPDTVGLSLEVDGTYAIELSKTLAVFGPVALTLLCLVLMFCSKRILTPWIVSAVTLIVPVYLWVINVFPF